MNIGDQLPPFELKDERGSIINSETLIGRPLVVYFYPKDDTPGCTMEACGFKDRYEDFEGFGASVVGISTDSPESHLRFKQKYNLPFMLLSDVDRKVEKLFKVKRNFFDLISARVTFVFNGKGKLIHKHNSQLNPVSHIKEALKALA
ncbi:MAG: peroxiredoxin [Cyclobacteriaceae bacterium]